MISKKFFVKVFAKAVKAANPDIDFLDYYSFDENGEEFVDIFYKNGYKKTVCVTADSLNAIMEDVLKKVI